MIVVGVDACQKGWVVAAWNTKQRFIELRVYPTFSDMVAAYPDNEAIAIDIPIGLIECQRACDVEARAALTCRKSSVFPAPDPRVVHMTDYHAANKRMKELCGKSVSAQAFGIFRKVAEVNDFLETDMQDRIIEIHPEVCFWAMNDFHDICAPKRSRPGYLTRLRLLKGKFKLTDKNWDEIEAGVNGAQSDDVLDALAAVWTAWRWVNGSFGRFPTIPECDAKKLRAEIVY
jgi:predicted RNase H-like nuclease